MIHKAIENSEDVCFNCLKEKNVTKIHIHSLGYGSSFDNESTRLNLCDDCLKLTNPEWWKLKVVKEDSDWCGEAYEFESEILEFTRSMPLEGRELFENKYSSDGYTMNSQDWIDYELDILPHEKCKEYSRYSPQEISAYHDRFPTCQHPANEVFSDTSKGCWCPFGAHGNYGQTCSINMSEECYLCEYYAQRTTPIRDILQKDFSDYTIYYKAKLNQEKYKSKFE